MIDLNGARSATTIHNMVWCQLLNLATQHRWRPAGTQAPDAHPDRVYEIAFGEGVSPEEAEVLAEVARAQMPEDPDLFIYFASETQVSAADAATLADALEEALPTLPDRDLLAAKASTDPSNGMPFITASTPVSPGEFFSGIRKGHVSQFIGFFREGGFSIGAVSVDLGSRPPK